MLKPIIKVHTREEAKDRLKILYDKGFRYVVRDEASEWLSCFNCKPKKNRDGSFWGYTQQDLNTDATLPVEPFKNINMEEISWSNRYPTLITEVIK